MLPVVYGLMNLSCLTDGEGDHGFIGVRGELHPIHDGPDGIKRVLGHLWWLHLPPLPAALGFGRIQTAIHADVVDTVPVYSLPIGTIQGFGVDGGFPVDSIPVHLHQVRLVIHPGTDEDDGQKVLEQQYTDIFPLMESTFT